MAEGTRQEVTITTYTLKLNEDEAQTLRDLVGFVSGSGSTRRRHISSISTALETMGLDFAGYDMSGEVRFNPF